MFFAVLLLIKCHSWRYLLVWSRCSVCPHVTESDECLPPFPKVIRIRYQVLTTHSNNIIGNFGNLILNMVNVVKSHEKTLIRRLLDEKNQIFVRIEENSLQECLFW